MDVCFISKFNFRKLSYFGTRGFFDKINLAELNEHFFERLESSLDIQRAKEKSSGNPGHDILEFCNVLVQVPSAISKTELDI